MKKYLLITLLLLTACTKQEILNQEILMDDEAIEIDTLVPDAIPDVYTDDNPITVGLYEKGRLLTSYKTDFKVHHDVGYFEVCFANDADLGSSNVKRNFNKYYQNYQDIDNYKIGYYVKFSIGEEIIEKVILDPSSMYIMAPYLYVYLYDDVHQADNAWYSHIEEKDVKDDTILSSIKLYAADGITKITSPIELMVFTYNDKDDFDEYGYYRGNSKYTLMIEKNV